MARTVTLDYIGKCDAADPHVMFRVLLNGQATISVPPLTVQNLLTTVIDREDAQDVAEFLLRIAAREWFRWSRKPSTGGTEHSWGPRRAVKRPRPRQEKSVSSAGIPWPCSPFAAITWGSTSLTG